MLVLFQFGADFKSHGLSRAKAGQKTTTVALQLQIILRLVGNCCCSSAPQPRQKKPLCKTRHSDATVISGCDGQYFIRPDLNVTDKAMDNVFTKSKKSFQAAVVIYRREREINGGTRSEIKIILQRGKEMDGRRRDAPYLGTIESLSPIGSALLSHTRSPACLPSTF